MVKLQNDAGCRDKVVVIVDYGHVVLPQILVCRVPAQIWKLFG